MLSTEVVGLILLRIIGTLALFSDRTFGKSLVSLDIELSHPISAIATNEPYPGNFICAVHMHRVTLYGYSTILAIETIFLGMALRQAWMYRGSRLMERLARDSVFYFFM